MKKFFIIASVALVVLVGAVFGVISIATYKPTVAFYNLDERTQEAVKKELASFVKEGGKPFKYNLVVLDTKQPLSQQKSARKAKLVFTALDADITDFVQTNSKIKGQPLSILDGFPSTTRNTALVKNNSLLAVPLLYDFVQMDILRPVFNESEMESLSTWEDLVTLTDWSKDSMNYPIIFAGKDDATYLEVFGAMVEAFCGSAVYEDASQKLYNMYKIDQQSKNGDYTQVKNLLEEMCSEDGMLYSAVQEFKTCLAQNVFAPEASGMSITDLIFFMDNKLSPAVINTLSQHRGVSFREANDFVSIYVPAPEGKTDRMFQAKQICAFTTSKKKEFSSILNLFSSSRQSSLSMNSTLAPVFSSCAASDRQSDDVRYWIAASEGPLLPLSQYFPCDDARKAAAETLKLILR